MIRHVNQESCENTHFSRFFEYALPKGKSHINSPLESFTPTDSTLKLESESVYTLSETSLFTIITTLETSNYRGVHRHREEKHTSEQIVSRSVDPSRSRIDHFIDAPGPSETLIFSVFKSKWRFGRERFRGTLKTHFALI